MRKGPSGVSITCAIARLTMPGNAANKIPSIAKTKPIATKKSDIVAGRNDGGYRGAAGAGVGDADAGVRGAPEEPGVRFEFSRGLPDGSTK